MQISSFTGACPSGSGSGGGGTVTSITEDVNLFPEVLVNGVASYTITGSGTFAWSKKVQAANTVWAGPTSGAAAVPVFRSLVPADGNGAFWTLVGNTGTTPASNWIGTNDLQDWVWKTDGTERGRILGTGQFGFGTPQPGRLVDVGPATAVTTGGFGIARAQVQDMGGPGGAVYNVKAWDASANGVTPTQQAFENAIEQVAIDFSKGLLPAWGATLEVPPGTYRFENAVTPFGAPITIPLRVKGAGIGITVFECDFAIPGALFSFSLTSPAANETNPEGLFHGPIFEGISFNNVGAVVVTAFIQVNVDGIATKPIEGTTIRDCEFNNAQIGIALYETAATIIDHVTTRPGNTINEIKFSNVTFPDAGDSVITNCDFQSRLMAGTGVQVDITGTNGLKITNNKFNGSFTFDTSPYCHLRFVNTNDAAVTAAPGTDRGAQGMIIDHNSFESAYRYSILFTGIHTGNQDSHNIISNNYFGDPTNGRGGHRVTIAPLPDTAPLGPSHPAPVSSYGATLFSITDNVFARAIDDGINYNCIELVSTADGAIAPDPVDPTLGYCSNFNIEGNSFATVRGGDTAIYMNAKAQNNHVGDNYYTGFTVPNNLDPACTTEGITLFGTAAHVGNFIEAYRGAKTSANLKFRVDEEGEAVIRWANIGARGDQPAGFLSTCSINESNFIPTPTANTDTLAILSPRVDGGYIAVTGNSDVAGCAATGLDIIMGVNTAGTAPAAGTYTGLFLSCAKSTAGPVTTPVFYVDYRPQVVMYNVAAPAAIGATVGQLYFDIADSKFHVVDGAGNHAI